MTTPQTSVESPIRKVSNGLIPQRELNGSRECDLNTRIRWVVLASFQRAVARPVGRRLRSVGLHWGFIPVASCDACYFGAPKVGWNLWAFARALADARRTTVCFRFFRIWENSRGLKQSENFSPWYSKLCCACRSHISWGGRCLQPVFLSVPERGSTPHPARLANQVAGRQCMPKSHRNFLENLEHGVSVRAYCLREWRKVSWLSSIGWHIARMYGIMGNLSWRVEIESPQR